MIYWCPLLPTWHKFWFLPVENPAMPPQQRCFAASSVRLLWWHAMWCRPPYWWSRTPRLVLRENVRLKPWVFHGFFSHEIWFPGVLHVFPINSGIIPSSNLSTTPQKSINAMDVSVNIAGNKTWSGLMLKNFFKPHHPYGFVWKYHWNLTADDRVPHWMATKQGVNCNSSTLNQHQFQHSGCARNWAGDMCHADQDQWMKF